MNAHRTFWARVRIGRRRTCDAGAVARHLLSLLVTILPARRLALAVRVLLMVVAGPTLCAAQAPGASHVPAGIRNPLNAEQYMQELAGKLNPSIDKDLLLKGTSPRPGTPSSQPPAPKATAVERTRPIPLSTVATPKPIPANPTRQVVKAGSTSPGELFTNFWSSQGVQPPAALNTAETRATPTPQTASARPSPAGQPPTQVVMDQPRRDILGTLGVAMASTRPGLTLWTTPTPAYLATIVTDHNLPQEPNLWAAQTPWSLGADLDKYRAHALREGSRDSGDSLVKAIERAGFVLEDGANIFVLGYASDRGEPFRRNDGKGLLDEPGRVPQQVGATAGSLGAGVYSLADLALLNSLPDPCGAAYQDNHPVVRPLIFTGQTIGGAWKTTEEVGNAVTWGYFDNVTGCLGMVIEGLMEALKHAGQAATNLVRTPVRMVAGNNEETERTMDWVLLVPLEFVSNAAAMKGIANMHDYERAFEDKGVVGSLIEFGGSGFLVYRSIDKALDELDNNDHRRRSRADAETPTDPETPSDPGIPELPDDLVVIIDGDWPVEGAPAGSLVLVDGVWTIVGPL